VSALIDLLYRLRTEEAQDRPITPVLLDRNAAAAAILVTPVALVVPADRIFILTSAMVLAIPDAAQTIVAVTVELISAANANSIAVCQDRPNLAAGFDSSINFSGMVLVPPGWTVRGRGDFNAAAAANTVFVEITGYTTPVGNVDRSV